MERLTKRITENQIELSKKANKPQHYSPIIHIEHPFWTAFDKLAEYEQAEEDGLLIRLPCKVGDTLYTFNLIKDEVIEFRAESEGFIVDILKYGLLGRTTFLTKAEAEQALAKMKGV